jgi:hypothetical protein
VRAKLTRTPHVASTTFALPRSTAPLTDRRHNDSITIEITIKVRRRGANLLLIGPSFCLDGGRPYRFL